MIWQISHQADTKARIIADRHYSRQKPGTKQFTPPGRKLVLYAKTDTGQAVWVTSWPYAEYVRRDWKDAWLCAMFRNEGAGRASEMIRQAVAVTKAHYGAPPASGMITLIDAKKVKPTMRRGKATWGYTYELAGFKYVGKTKGGLLVFQLKPEDMPEAEAAYNKQVAFDMTGEV